MAQASPFLSTDPNAGKAAASPFLSTDPNAGATPLPVFRETNAKDTHGNAIVDSDFSRIPDPDGALSQSAETAPVGRAYAHAGPGAVMQGWRDLKAGNYARGLNEILNGGLMTAAPMLGPAGVEELIARPLATAATAGGVAAAQALAAPAAREVGATPDQADLAGTVAGLGVGAAIAKVGVPALAKWSTNNKAVTMGKDYLQSTRDIQAALGVNAADVHAARPFLEAVHANDIPIVGKEGENGAAGQLVKAANVAVDHIENHIKSVVQQFPDATVPPAHNAILSKVAQMPGSKASDLAAARKVIADYGLDQPRSLADAESLRTRLNAENRSTLSGSGVKQRDAAMTDPAYVARQQAANSLRDGIYDTLEENGVQGIRDLRRSEGSIIAIRNAADPSTRGLKSESTVARTGETSLPRRIGQIVLRGGGAAAGASVAGLGGAAVGAEIGNDLGAGLTSKNMSKNALLERAFSQSFTSPPVMSTQQYRPTIDIVPQGGPRALSAPGLPAAPPPPPAAQLGPGARPMAAAPDASFVRGSSATPATRVAPERLALPAATRPMPAAPDESGVSAGTPRTIVVRDPKTGRMKRFYLTEVKDQ